MNKLARIALVTLPCIGVAVADSRDVPVSPATELTTQVGSELTIDLPSGEVHIGVSDDDQLHASVDFYCRADHSVCFSNADRARIVHEQRGDSSVIRFKPGSAYTTRHANLTFKVLVPAVEQLSVAMDAGDLNIESPTGCLSVRAGAGDISVRAPAAGVAGAILDANVGDTSLRTPTGRVQNRRTMLVGSETRWAGGVGDCDLRVKLQTGAINAELVDAGKTALAD